jgi:hypothetical protein
MNEIKPIETFYKGYKFRSRLEARWAYFFDLCGVRWTYEPEGYDLGNSLYYLPDFKIYHIGIGGSERQGIYFDIYVEVKGKMSEKDSVKINAFGNNIVSNLYIPESLEEFSLAQLWEYPLILVGNIPKGIGDMIKANLNSIYKPRFYDFRNILVGYGDMTACLGYKSGDLVISSPYWDDYWWDDDKYPMIEKTEELLAKAGSARFEFGETPKI